MTKAHMAYGELKKLALYVIQAREYFIISYHSWAMIWSIIVVTVDIIMNVYLLLALEGP